MVVIGNEDLYQEVKERLVCLSDLKFIPAKQALADVVQMDTVDIVLTALVGYAGLIPTLKGHRSR